jgi:hypothetical protein
MRIVVIAVLLLLAACASDPLALAPPAGVDLSGRWLLNEADSDDPQRLATSQAAGAGNPGAGSSGGQQGQGGRGGGRGGRGSRAGGGMGAGVPATAPLPPLGTLRAGLRWPGKEVAIKQVGGAVAITSAGVSQVYQPAPQAKQPRHRPSADDEGGGRDRDMRSRDRGEEPPPHCGWDGRTLVVQTPDADEDHPPFEERYSLSEDGQRLIEVVGFTGGRSAGFTMFRVWDRAP